VFQDSVSPDGAVDTVRGATLRGGASRAAAARPSEPRDARTACAQATAQTTLASSATIDGVGLHTGAPVRMVLRPAPADAGVVFRRVDLLDEAAAEDRQRRVSVRASAFNVGATRLGTTIENEHGASVATVEHVMAAIAGLALDNVLIEIDGPECPIMDGSAAPFAEAILAAGVRALDAPVRAARLARTIEIVDGDKSLRAEPADRFEIEVEIEFDAPAIGRQSARIVLTPDRFMDDVAGARTFCLKRDIDMMRELGLARGGSLDNAVVVDGADILNEEGLRLANEFAMHKALDLLGDLRLAGPPPAMRVVASRPGHALNTAFARLLLETPGALVRDAEAEAAEGDAEPVRATA